MFGLDGAAYTFVFNVGPLALQAAVWGTILALGLRRSFVNAPGARPIVAAAAASVLTLLCTVWLHLSFLFHRNGTSGLLGQPAAQTIILVNIFVSVAAPPLLLWGLWLTWRGFDRAGTEETP